MGFPVVPLASQGRVLTANQLNTTATRTFPAMSGLTKNPGDLLIAIIVAYQTSTGTDAAFSGWSDGFTEFHDSATSTTLAMGAAYKWSDGTETAAPTVTQAATITGDASMILLSIPAAHASTPPEAGSRASGTTGAADPASFNPAGWGTEDTLWISVVGSGMTSGTGSWTATGTTAPSNYTDRVDTNASDTSTIGDCEAAVAFRQLNAASEDVGTAGVDLSNARNGAFVIAVRPAAFAPNGESDAWVDPQGDIAPAIAKAAAGLALAVSILNGFNQQEEWVTAPPPETRAGHESQEVVAIGRNPVPAVFVYDDDIAPQAATPALDDSGWLADKPPPPRVVWLGPDWDDSVPARIVDDVYQWTQPGIATRAIPTVAAVDDEIVPQPATQIVDEVYEVWPYVETVQIVVTPSEPGGGAGSPDVAPQLVADEGWINESVPSRRVAPAFLADDEIVPQPAVLGVDADPWQAPTTHWRVVARAFVDDDQITQPPAGFTPDEQYELSLYVEPTETRVQPSELGGGAPTTPSGAPLGVEDSYWFTAQAYQRRATVFVPPATDEITTPSQASVGGGGGFPTIAAYSPEIVQWESVDDLPQPAVPLPVDEQYWQQPFSKPSAKDTIPWAVGDDIVPQPPALNVTEDEWQPPFSRAAAQHTNAWAIGDDIVPQPPALNIAEEYWQPPFSRAEARHTGAWAIGDEIVPQPASLDQPDWLELTARQAPAALQLWQVGDEFIAPLQIVEAEWDVYTPPYLPARFLYLPDPEEVFGTVVPPVYGWGARNRIGTRPARDVARQVGSTTARDPNETIGTQTAVDPSKRIGSEDA